MPLDHTYAGFEPAIMGSNTILEHNIVGKKRSLYTCESKWWNANFLTNNSANLMPFTELPIRSNLGDQTQIPHTFGTMIFNTPLTPDLAGNPTENAHSPLKSYLCCCIGDIKRSEP